jgi:transcription elongation factor Elf1
MRSSNCIDINHASDMHSPGSVNQNEKSWESVHVCPNCGHVVNLAELDLRAITTGIVTCPSCDRSGQIEIKVIDQVPRKTPRSVN